MLMVKCISAMIRLITITLHCKKIKIKHMINESLQQFVLLSSVIYSLNVEKKLARAIMIDY